MKFRRLCLGGIFDDAVYLGGMLDDFALVRFPRGFYLGGNLGDRPWWIFREDFALRGVSTLEGSLQRVDTLEQCAGGCATGSWYARGSPQRVDTLELHAGALATGYWYAGMFPSACSHAGAVRWGFSPAC